jgi:hypothetical protein
MLVLLAAAVWLWLTAHLANFRLGGCGFIALGACSAVFFTSCTGAGGEADSSYSEEKVFHEYVM